MPATLSPPPVESRRKSQPKQLPKLDPRHAPAHKPATERQATPSTTSDEREEMLASFDPSRLKWSNVDWTVTIFLVTIHAGAIAAPFFFSWWAMGVAAVLYWATASIGICLGYHRYLAHRSMKLAKPAEFACMAMGTISGEGTPLMWSAVHRLHHQKSDQEGDPHSPRKGGWWSHILWLFIARSKRENDILYRRYIPELLERPMLRFFEKSAMWWLIGTGLTLGGIGYLLSGWYGFASFVLWGFCMRMVVAYHATWLINSATHIWGYRNYKTRDDSKNLWWVALFSFGEGWHNNHHAHPTVAPAGHRWWEVDTTWWIIKALRFCGLAWDVNDRIPEDNGKAADGA